MAITPNRPPRPFSILDVANESSYIRRELMKEDYLSIRFSWEGFQKFYEGLHTTYGGIQYELEEDYLPSYNSSTCGFDYDMKFVAWYYRYDRYIFKEPGAYYPEWSMTDKPSAFFALLAQNFECSVIYEKDANGNCVIDSEVPYISVSFNATNCMDALTMIVDALDPDNKYYEWWFESDGLHIGKLGKDAIDPENYDECTPLKLGYNITSCSVQKGNSKPIGKLYVYGSDKNISSRDENKLQAINANTSVTDDNGNLIGYKDPNHKLLMRHFRNMYKTKRSICMFSSGETQSSSIKNEANAKSTITFQSQKSLPLNSKYSELSLTAQGQGDYTRVLLSIPEIKSGDMTIETTCDVYITCKLLGSNSTIYNDVVYSTSQLMSSVSSLDQHTEVKLPIPEMRFDTTNYTSLTLKVIVEFVVDEPAVTSPMALESYTIKAKFENFDYEVRTAYKCVKVNGNIIFNPLCLPETDNYASIFTSRGVVDKSMLIIGHLPITWFTSSESGTKITTTKRLTLDPTDYPNSCIEIEDGGDAEGQVIFEDVYPTMTGTITGMSEDPRNEKDSNDEYTGRVLNYISFATTRVKDVTDDDFIEDPTIIFTSGSMDGMEFQLKLISSNSYESTFCIIPNENYNALLPNSICKPKNGDTFKLVGIDASFYDDGTSGANKTDIYKNARDLLEARALAYVKDYNSNQNVYTMKLLPTNNTTAPAFGDGVVIIFSNSEDDDPEFEHQTRVIGFQHPLDLPLADYQVICGNSTSYKRIDALETKVTTSGNTGGGFVFNGDRFKI